MTHRPPVVPVRVVICDDQAVVREGITALLETAAGIEVVATAAGGQEAIDEIDRRACDLVLMDLNMPRVNGIEATREIRRRHPDVEVLVMTTYATDDWVSDALTAGAAGYLLKDTTRDELVAAIIGTVQGRTHLDPRVAGAVVARASGATIGGPAEEPHDHGLTERERQVLKLIALGRSNPEIGDLLHLSAGTVRNHASRIFDKLAATDRAHAAAIAVRLGLD